MIKLRTALVLSGLFVLILACAAPAQVRGPSAHVNGPHATSYGNQAVDSGPVCVRGCRCGNSCISCRYTCHH